MQCRVNRCARERWGDVDIPVLVMYGESTWPFLAAGAKSVAAVLPNTIIKAVPGENHSTTAEVLAPELRAFASGSIASGDIGAA